MRITAVMLALVATQAHADLTFTGEEFEIRLGKTPCTHSKVVDLLKEEWVPRFMQGNLIVENRALQMCWTVIRPGHVAILDEDGDAYEIPQAAFKEDVAL